MYRELLKNGWEHLGNDVSIGRSFSAGNYADLRDSGATDLGRLIRIGLELSESGEVEGDIGSMGDIIIPIYSAFSIGTGRSDDAVSKFITEAGEKYLSAFDPVACSYRQFFELMHYEGQKFATLRRAIVLPEGVDYVNKSAEIVFLLSMGFELFLLAFATGETSLKLNGEKVEDPAVWFERYLSKLRSLYPEYMWRGREFIEKTQKDAEDGLAEAQLGLGRWYNEGAFLPQDFVKAEYWWHKAAEAGLVEAQYELAVLNWSGDGIPKSIGNAAYWFQHAAKQGHIAAQSILGMLYYEGNGVPQDRMKASYWLRQAAEQGETNAQASLERLGL
jgi:hypothetical protein